MRFLVVASLINLALGTATLVRFCTEPDLGGHCNNVDFKSGACGSIAWPVAGRVRSVGLTNAKCALYTAEDCTGEVVLTGSAEGTRFQILDVPKPARIHSARCDILS